jgi:hypothetical protein
MWSPAALGEPRSCMGRVRSSPCPARAAVPPAARAAAHGAWSRPSSPRWPVTPAMCTPVVRAQSPCVRSDPHRRPRAPRRPTPARTGLGRGRDLGLGPGRPRRGRRRPPLGAGGCHLPPATLHRCNTPTPPAGPRRSGAASRRRAAALPIAGVPADRGGPPGSASDRGRWPRAPSGWPTTCPGAAPC